MKEHEETTNLQKDLFGLEGDLQQDTKLAEEDLKKSQKNSKNLIVHTNNEIDSHLKELEEIENNKVLNKFFQSFSTNQIHKMPFNSTSDILEFESDLDELEYTKLLKDQTFDLSCLNFDNSSSVSISTLNAKPKTKLKQKLNTNLDLDLDLDLESDNETFSETYSDTISGTESEEIENGKDNQNKQKANKTFIGNNKIYEKEKFKRKRLNDQPLSHLKNNEKNQLNLKKKDKNNKKKNKKLFQELKNKKNSQPLNRLLNNNSEIVNTGNSDQSDSLNNKKVNFKTKQQNDNEKLINNKNIGSQLIPSDNNTSSQNDKEAIKSNINKDNDQNFFQIGLISENENKDQNSNDTRNNIKIEEKEKEDEEKKELKVEIEHQASLEFSTQNENNNANNQKNINVNKNSINIKIENTKVKKNAKNVKDGTNNKRTNKRKKKKKKKKLNKK